MEHIAKKITLKSRKNKIMELILFTKNEILMAKATYMSIQMELIMEMETTIGSILIKKEEKYLQLFIKLNELTLS